MNRAYLIAPIVVLAICVCGVAVTDHADDSAQVSTWTSGDTICTLDDNGVFTVSGSGAMANYSTASARPWHQSAQSIVSVVFEDGVTAIGNYTFAECYYLTSVDMARTMQTVGQYAFKGCSSLTSINYNVGLQSIGHYSCQDCIALKSITIPRTVNSIYAGAFQGCVSMEDIRFETATWNVVLASASFSLGTAATPATAVVSSPNNVADGKLDSYKGSYTTLTYAPSIMTWTSGDTTCTLDMTRGIFTVSGTGAMADYAQGSDLPWYTYRANINSVVIEDGVTSVGGHAFYDCTSLTSVTIGNSVTSIGIWAFYNCNSLASLTIGNSVQTIGNSAFDGCTSLASVAIPDSVTSIGGATFYRCTSLASLTIGNSVQTIGNSAFDGCTSLASVAIPNSVTSIGNDALQRCTSLESVTFGNGITSIPKRVCDSCSALESVTIGNSVQTIDQGAFYFCTSLASMTIPDSVTSIESNAFYHCESMTTLELGSGLLTIGPDAFRDCSAITEIVIPGSVTSIGAQAFQDCTSVTSIDIGAGVTSIDQRAFQNCPVVERIIFRATAWNVTAIGSEAFGLGVEGHPTTAIVYSHDNVANGRLDDYKNTNTVLYYLVLPTYAVEITVNNTEWGSVNLTHVMVEEGTVIGADGNILHIGTLDVVATANQPTAQYTYEFVNWTGIPESGTITQDITVTANFDAEINRYTVTFTVNDPTYGRVDLGFVEADYGTLIEPDGSIIRINDSEITAIPADPSGIYSYSFLRWDGLTERVVGDSTITAVFSVSASIPASEYIDGTTHKEYSDDGGIIAIIYSIVPLLLGLMIIAGLASSMGAFRR